MPSAPSEPRISQTVRKRNAPEARAPEQRSAQPRKPLDLPVVKTDIEELLPLSQGVKSLPRPPRLPTFEAPLMPAPTTRRFPWMSLSIFAVVLGASLAPLVRYRGERTTTAAPVSLHMKLRDVDWSAMSSEGRFGEPLNMREALLEQGERALQTQDLQHAEASFAQALSFGDADAAFGLARARLAQGDATGARAWADAALRRRPEDARYRAFLVELRQHSAPPTKTR